MSEPEWLDIETVLEIHREVIAASGGSDGLRDSGLLESALTRPLNVLAYENGTIFDLAATMPRPLLIITHLLTATSARP